MNLYVGTSGYSYKEWKGPFYPKDLSDKKMLHYYGEHFRTVEINYSFRGVLKESLCEKWAAEVPGDFKFILKAPQRITHIQRLKNTEKLISDFFQVVKSFKNRLGPILFQLPPTLQKDISLLRDFLQGLPSKCLATVEFRHPSWFDEEVFELLQDHRAALCLAEAENDLEIPFVSTTDWGYIRLRCPTYTDKELKMWIDRIEEQDWQQAFVFFKHEDEGKGPQMAKQFLELAEKKSKKAIRNRGR